jgi:hypothetical protein
VIAAALMLSRASSRPASRDIASSFTESLEGARSNPFSVEGSCVVVRKAALRLQVHGDAFADSMPTGTAPAKTIEIV